MSKKTNKNKNSGKSSKGEKIAYIILGCLGAVIIALIIAVAATTGTSAGGTTILPPCCQ